MNKLLTDTCQCGCNPTLPENLLKITAGNDFSIKLQLTEKIDDNWVHYDMTDMSNVIVSVMSPNNTATELDYIIDVSGNIQAIVDAQKFQSYIIYGIEVLWRDETDLVPVDKRAYAPNVFAFVNSSMEATDSSYEYTSDSPYEYNISMSNDVALLSIGYIPDGDMSDYYTKEEINSTLENYATDQDVADAIAAIDTSNYVTNSSLATTLQDYETKSELSTTLQDYVTDSELTTTLNPYATQQYVDDAIDNIDIDTTNFYTKSDIDTTLTSYATSISSPGWLITGGEPNYMWSYQIKLNHNGTELNRVRIPAHTKSKNSDDQWYTPFYSALLKNNDYIAFLNGLDTLSEISSDYVTNSSLNTTLQDYVTDTELSTELSPIESDITSLDGRVTTLENNPSVPSNVVTSDDGNEIVCLTQSEYDTLEQNDQLDPDVFYYITDATSNYVTNSSLTTTLADYVTDTELQTAIGNIPTVNNATLTIQKNGTTVNTFTANASSNVTANITVPTATSDLINDSGFITINDVTASGVSEEDWENSNEAIAQELANNRLAHLSINDNFNNYYTKTEADSRYATSSWANSRFVTQADDANRQQAIAAAFASSVQSTSVHNIWTGSQNDYDAITSKDINTLYIIL